MPVSSGRRDKYISVENPDGPPVPDPTGEGGWTQPYAPIAGVFAAIDPATVRSLEQFRSDTVIATASHIVTIPFMAGITIQTRLKYGTRTLEVRGYVDPSERGIELLLACEELAQATISREDAV